MKKLIYSLCFFVMLFLNANSQNITNQNGYSKNNIDSQISLINHAVTLEKSQIGITNFSDFGKTFVPIGPAPIYQKEFNIKKVTEPENSLIETSWELCDSTFINSFVPAGSNVGVKVNIPQKKLDLISPYSLSDEAIAAVKKAPSWLRPALTNTLSKVNKPKQKDLANVINNANDPYIDEIAYAIAFSSSAYLNLTYCYPQLFLDNAKLIYAHDSDLKYVEIIDYGNSKTDDNYYSTVKYFKIDTNGNKVQIEVPREIYYEYIVHPKTSDEIASYINPSVFEHDQNYANHVYNIAAPPAGVFWRDYLYNVTEQKDTTGAMYPILKDSVKNCDVLWDETNKQNSAVKEIGEWVRAVMKFDSKQERPHQPVRIYKLHLGRCGEHEDITNAATRACLIPCRGIEAFSSDHVWNEFWDERWWQWEPVNTSYKDNFCYSSGWGKKFGSVFARTSSGINVPVTDNYCKKTSKIVIYVKDSNKKPIDGALITLAVKGTLDSTSIFIDSYGITDNEGKFTFIVDAGRDYFGRMDCSLGNDPISTGNVYNLVQGATENQTYQFELKAAGTMPKYNFTPIQLPPDTLEDYKLMVNYYLKDSYTNWSIRYDDLGSGYTYFPGTVSKPALFIADEDNFLKLNDNKQFSGISKLITTPDNSFVFDIPNNTINWNCVFNGDNSLSNYSFISAGFALYRNPLTSVKNNSQAEINQIIISPNPANYFVNIQNIPSSAEITIVNSLGEIVLKEKSKSKEYAHIDISSLPTGIYFVRIGEKTSKFIKM